jgi:hypothetical protein
LSLPDAPPAGGGNDPGSKERLQRISRHFLSDEDGIRRIAVVTDPDQPCGFPVDGLARALAGRGRGVAVIDAAAGLFTLTCPDPAPQSATGREPEPGLERVMSKLRDSGPPDILLIASSCSAAPIASCDLALLAVPTHARGMRSAYLALKALAQLASIPPIGVTLTGAQGRDDAAAAYAKFAIAAHRFLDVRITSYSYLAVEAARGTGRSTAAASLEIIARLLLEDARTAAAPRNPLTRAQP